MSRQRRGARPHFVSLADCLRDARAALAAHLALRPATVDEARLIASNCEAEALWERLQARALLTSSTSLLNVPHAACDAVKGAMHYERRAANFDAHAAAWNQIAAEPEGAQYHRTRAELEARVARYEQLMAVAEPGAVIFERT